MRLLAVFVFLSLPLLHAQRTKTRELAEYSAHVQFGSISVASDFWGHSIPLADGSLKSDGYLVVEVAFFAPPQTKIEIRTDQFALLINGQRLLPQYSGLVTLGYVVPDMRQRGPRVEAGVGVGPVIVSAGRDPIQPKFPGDNNPADNNPADIPLPPRPQTTDPELRKDPLDPVKSVGDAALPEGTHAAPISGYLFFAYSPKLKHVKRAELEYTSPYGTATLSLR